MMVGVGIMNLLILVIRSFKKLLELLEVLRW